VRWQAGAEGHRRVRVSPELIRVADSTTRWQEPFDTEINDVFQVQADNASRVAQALDVALGATTKEQLAARPTGNVAAYDAFLRGEQESQGLTLSDNVPLRKALAHYEQAVALDPAFVQAWAQLSRAACRIASTSPTPADVDSCRAGAEKAVALAPNRPESRLAMGYYFRTMKQDFQQALEQFALGLQAAPNDAELLASSANIERSLGRFDEGLAHLQRAASLDPRSVTAASGVARAYRDAHRMRRQMSRRPRAVARADEPCRVSGEVTGHLSQGDISPGREPSSPRRCSGPTSRRSWCACHGRK
jgi:tetratricopeptide (TPR) repeat protein